MPRVGNTRKATHVKLTIWAGPKKAHCFQTLEQRIASDRYDILGLGKKDSRPPQALLKALLDSLGFSGAEHRAAFHSTLTYIEECGGKGCKYRSVGQAPGGDSCEKESGEVSARPRNLGWRCSERFRAREGQKT